MSKQSAYDSTRTNIQRVQSKHANAVWEVEKLWTKIPPHNYALRRRLVSSAVSLAKIAQEIDDIRQKESV